MDFTTHTHTQTYLSTHHPISAPSYPPLRRAIVRVLSGEHLPKGLTSGRLFFGNAEEGFVIAYTFRLPDPYARGGGRLYSFLALAGAGIGDHAGSGDASVDGNLVPGAIYDIVAPIWRRFEELADWLTEKVMRRNEEMINETATAVAGTTSSSNDGSDNERHRHGTEDLHRRRHHPLHNPSHQQQQQQGRSLADLTGDEQIFAKVHWRFVDCFGLVGG